MTESSIKGITTVLYPVEDLEKAKTVYAALLGTGPQTDESYYVGSKLAQVEAAGATITEAPHEVGGGRLVASFTDLDGNVLGLIEDH